MSVLRHSADLLKTSGAIKSDFQSETVITNKKSNSKMRFGKMLASAAILGCTSAVNLNTENAIEATV